MVGRHRRHSLHRHRADSTGLDLHDQHAHATRRHLLPPQGGGRKFGRRHGQFVHGAFTRQCRRFGGATARRHLVRKAGARTANDPGRPVAFHRPLHQLLGHRLWFHLAVGGARHFGCVCLLAVSCAGQIGLAVLHSLNANDAAHCGGHTDLPDVPRSGVERHPLGLDPALHRGQPVAVGVVAHRFHGRDTARVRRSGDGGWLHPASSLPQSGAAAGRHWHCHHGHLLFDFCVE